MTWVEEAVAAAKPQSVGLLGNAPRCCPNWSRAASRPMSSPIRPRRTIPVRVHPRRHDAGRRRRAAPKHDPRAVPAAGDGSRWPHTSRRCLTLQAAGAVVFDYGNNLRQRAFDYGVKDAFDYPGFVPAYIRPLFCEGKGPFRWVALSGDPEDIYRTDRGDSGAVPGGRAPGTAGFAWRRNRSSFRGCRRVSAGWVTANAPKPGWRSTRWSRAGEISAPIVIGRDHLDCGSVASPNRETEGDARRLRRHHRLAHSQRADQCRERRHLGQLPSRRRRGHRLQPARGPGHRGRRHAGSGAPPGARAAPSIRAWASCATPMPAMTKQPPSPASTVSGFPTPLPAPLLGERVRVRGQVHHLNAPWRTKKPASRSPTPFTAPVFPLTLILSPADGGEGDRKRPFLLNRATRKDR